MVNIMKRKLDLKPSVIWVGGEAFVQIVSARLMEVSSNLTLEIRVLNKHNAVLKEVECEINFYDSADKILNAEPYVLKSKEFEISQNSIGLAAKLDVGKLYPQTRKTDVKLINAKFDDGNFLEFLYENMEKYVDEELEIDSLELLRKTAGKDAYCLSSILTYNWRCVCGFFNGSGMKTCSNCGRSKKDVIENYSSMNKLIVQIEKEIEGEYNTYQKNVEENKPQADDFNEDEKEPILSDIRRGKKTEKMSTSKMSTSEMIKEFMSEYPKSALTLLLVSGVFVFAAIFLLISNALL